MTRMRIYVVLIGMLLVLVSSVQVMAQATPTATSTTEFEITGTVDSIGIGTITISGQVIQSTQAEIKAQIAVGAFVKAHVSVGPNGALVAREIELALDTDTDFADDELEIVGTVEAFTADTITIGGQVIQMTQAEIKAQIAVGAQLKIHLAVGADGALIAREVELAQERERVRLTNGDSDDSSGHDLNDDHGNDSSGHDLNDDHGDDGSEHDINDDHGGEQNDNSGQGSSSDDDHGDHHDDGESDDSEHGEHGGDD